VTCPNIRILTWLPLLCGGLAFGQNGALRVVEPVPAKDGTIMTSEPSLSLRGTLAWTGGDMRVLWKNQRGFSDLATVTVAEDRRTVLWHTTAPIPLRPGVNHVRIQALGQPGAATFVNIYYTVSQPPPPRPQRTTFFKGQQITYEVIDGRAVYQRDMILGDEAEVARGRFAGRFASGGTRLRPQSATITPNLQYFSGLWPVVNGVVRVPYTIAGASGNVTNIDAAIAESNTQLTGVVQWVPATGSDVNLVNFDFEGAANGSCEAIVGMQGNGSQPISGASNCTVGTIMHEMGHALGLYHEQSRADRDTYIQYAESNVDKPLHANFDILQNEAVSGLYNYASIMEYSPFLFSRYGTAPVIETIPAGMVLGTDLNQYTTGDLDGIMRLYGFTPSKVTVDTNPTGLQVVVDGTAYTAPQVFTWTLGSQHALSVPLDSHGQTLQIPSLPNPPQPYIFGRWNAGPASQQTVTITNSAGNGTLLSPTTSPAITNYLASFIPIHPYNPQIQPANAATISASTPSTLIINGNSTNYYVDRQYITLNVQPNHGYSFYEWANVPLDTLYAGNYSFYITSNFDYYNFDPTYPVEVSLVTDPVLTIEAETADNSDGTFFPGFAIGVVAAGNGIIGYTPRNFDQSNDGNGFAPGASLTLCASGLNGTSCPSTAPLQSPVTTNITYAFSSWIGVSGSTNTNAISYKMPTSSQAVGADFTDSFRVIILPSSYCTDISVNTQPSVTSSNPDGGLDAFFTAATTTFVANAGSGLDFVGWSGDLGSSVNPYSYYLGGELIATANFNVATTNAPLAVTGVSPATPTATGSAVTLTVTGTGFTTNGNTYGYLGVGGGHFDPRTITVQSSTQLTMQLQAGDLASVGYSEILIVNTGGSGCNPQTPFTFPVMNSAGAPALSISKMHTGVFGPGQKGAQYTVTVRHDFRARNGDGSRPGGRESGLHVGRIGMELLRSTGMHHLEHPGAGAELSGDYRDRQRVPDRLFTADQ
jgi:astacin